MRLEHEFKVDNNKYQFSEPSSSGDVRVSGDPDTPDEEARLTYIYNKLEKINSVLSDPKTTEHQAIEILKEYHDLMSDNEIIKTINSSDSETARKATGINDEIQEYLIRRDMITFGYFVDKMDTVAKYSNNIGFKYHRDGFHSYTKYFQGLTTILSSYGEYLDGTEDDGKIIRVKQHQFYKELMNYYKKYYPVNSELKNSDGDKCSLYSGKFEIIIGDDGRDKTNCSIYIDGVLIESGIDYNKAYERMEYFYSGYKKPINGTKVIRQVDVEYETSDGDVVIKKITATADVIAYPEALLRWIEIPVEDSLFTEVNDNTDLILDKLNDINVFKLDLDFYSGKKSYIENHLNNEFKKEFNDSFINRPEFDKDQIRKLNNGKLNSYNTTIDGIKKELQMSLDEFSQKFNTINSNYDNILKVITTMISELTQELKGFLRF